eukprot:COSAG04_NODE_8253_length_1001_cov_1.033259_2_plen_235_part_00
MIKDSGIVVEVAGLPEDAATDRLATFLISVNCVDTELLLAEHSERRVRLLSAPETELDKVSVQFCKTVVASYFYAMIRSSQVSSSSVKFVSPVKFETQFRSNRGRFQISADVLPLAKLVYSAMSDSRNSDTVQDLLLRSDIVAAARTLSELGGPYEPAVLDSRILQVVTRLRASCIRIENRAKQARRCKRAILRERSLRDGRAIIDSANSAMGTLNQRRLLLRGSLVLAYAMTV